MFALNREQAILAIIYFGIKTRCHPGRVAGGCSFECLAAAGNRCGASGCLPLLHRRGSVQLVAVVHRRDLMAAAGRRRHGTGAAEGLLGRQGFQQHRARVGDAGTGSQALRVGLGQQVGVVRVAAGRRRAVQGHLGLHGLGVDAEGRQREGCQHGVRRRVEARQGQGSGTVHRISPGTSSDS
jgi:hypothetical protein